MSHQITRLCLRGIALLAVLGLGSSPAQATKYWKNSVVTGNWGTGTNWSAVSAAGADNGGVPVGGEAVNIVFTDGVARTVTYNVSAPSLSLLSVDLTGAGTTASTLSMPSNFNLSANGILIGGYNGATTTAGRGAMTQSAGTATTNPGWDLVAGYGVNSTGTYMLSGTGALVANQSEYIGLNGNGTFNHSAGTNTIATATGFFEIGTFAGSTGTYNLSGTGVLTVKNNEYVGDIGTGFFNQTGGTHNINTGTNLYLGYNAAGTGGTYNLSGGILAVNNSGLGGEYVGYRAAGTFNQSGGTNQLWGTGLHVGTLAGSTGLYTLSAGTCGSNAGEIIGESGTGTFTQTGGDNGTGAGSSIFIGYNAGSNGTYNLSGSGSLNSGFDLHVGDSGSGTFNQSGGTSSTAEVFILGFNAGATGTYNLSAGSLLANGIPSYSTIVGHSGTGVFNQSGGTSNFNGVGVVLGNLLGGNGTFTLSGGNATVAGYMILGGLSNSGTGVLTVSNSGVLTVGSGLQVVSNPGNVINLSGGTINTAALDLAGAPALLNWTSGTLNITNNVTWDPSVGFGTSFAFGTERTLGNNQTLKISGNETLGGTGAFGLTLNSGSTHHVTGMLTINPAGTIIQNAGSTLYAATITQSGGTVNGTLQNLANFIYQSGQFNGRLLNQGTVNLGPSFTAGNGLENDATMVLTSGQTLTVNGAGLDNLGTFTLSGGVISGSGPAVNNFGGTLHAHGTINPTFTNNGVLDVDGVLRLNGPSATNNGIVSGSGTLIGSFTNAAGGAVELATGKLMAISNAWTNSGLVTLDSGAALGGGTITNTGTIQGRGTVNAAIGNNGIIRASGGDLNLGAAGDTNTGAGLIQASTGNTVMVLQGLTNNAGTIALTGGAFDNNNHALANTGVINGYGAIRTSALTNTNKFNVGEGNFDVFGIMTNNGSIGIQGGRSVYFFGNVSGSGSYTGTGTAVFLAALSPGSSPAAVNFGGNATLAATTTLNMELGGTTAGTQYDQLLVSGALALGGGLDVSLINDFMPSAGQSFNLLDWGALSGTFSTIQLPTLAGGLSWNTSQLYSTGVLSVAAPGLPGDYNFNGVVDAADYVVWRKGLGTIYTQNDHDVWRANFGQTVGNGSGTTASTSVPEPASAILLLLAFLIFSWAFIAERRAVEMSRNSLSLKELPAICRIIQKLATTGLSSLLAVVLCLSPAMVVAATRYWKNSVASPGSWTSGNNWSTTSANGLDFGGAPGANDTVNIRLTDGADHTVTYNVGSPLTLTQLNVDVTGGSATTATLSMSANDLTSSNEWIGYSGRGTFEQSGGTNTIPAGSGFLDVGVFAGSKGTYNLSGTGSLVVNTIEYIGDVGTGVFNQTGGTNSISGPTPDLYLGYNAIGTGGTYNLSGGALSTIEGIEAVGHKSVGTFNQSGGTNYAKALRVAENASGTYTLSGGTLTAVLFESVGQGAAGTFNHTGGTNNAGFELDVGNDASSSGTYSLSGTGVLSTGTEYIGFGGRGTFTQTGGTNTTEILELDNGTYTLSGTGALTVTWKFVISNLFANNSFNFNGGTINAAALDFSGDPARFHWTSGTLNLTQNVVWDPTRPDSTSVVFGSLLALGANKTLMITGNETLGGTGAFGLTLNSGSTHQVTGGILLSPTGTIIQNAGSTLTYSTLTQAGGAFNGTLQNQGKFIYQSGQFNGQMVNGSGAYLVVAGEFSASNLVNNGDMVVINTSIGGPVVNNNAVTVVGSVDFNGLVSGPGGFFGPGTAHFNGGMSPGASPANVSFEGNLALAVANTLFIEIGGTTPGSQYDRLTIAGSASIDGTLNVSLINGFTPSGGQQFTILTASSIVNNGFELAGSAASSFNLLVNSSSVILQAIGLPGDFNHDNKVDAADYVVWRKGLGTTYTQNDYNLWRSHFGQTAGSGAGANANAAVPEPASLMLTSLAAACGYLRRRRAA